MFCISGLKPSFQKLKTKKFDHKPKEKQDSIFGFKISIQQKPSKVFKPSFARSSSKIRGPFSVFKRDQIFKKSLMAPFKIRQAGHKRLAFDLKSDFCMPNITHRKMVIKNQGN